jgi:SAM-dependent methyltransferase
VREATGQAYACGFDDPVRARFERHALSRVLARLLGMARGARILDLGCGDALVARLAEERLDAYLGVDLQPPAGGPERCRFVRHDLRGGLGALARVPFDLCLATFGTASHLSPAELRRIVEELATNARPGALVALEALGLYSLEWPRLWESRPAERTIPYRMAADVPVHPWSAGELRAMYEGAGLRWLGAVDRSVQAGQKLGDTRYWPGTPALRAGLNALLAGNAAGAATLDAPLPPLPAHGAARFHHALAVRRRALVREWHASPAELAEAVWALEPRSGAGLGHGLLAVGYAA